MRLSFGRWVSFALLACAGSSTSSPPQCWPVWICRAIWIWFGFPAPAQCRLAEIQVSQRFDSDCGAGHPSFYLIEFIGGDNVLFARREHGPDFFLGPADPLRGHRMAGKQPGNKVAVLLLVDRNPFKEVDEGKRIIAGSVLIFQPQQVCFALLVSPELEKGHGHGDVGNLMD